MMNRDLSQTTLESFLMSIASLEQTDLRSQIHQIKIPAMGMYGDRDIVVCPDQWQPLLEGIPHARIERFPRAGHFIMLDEPGTFMQTLHDFLNGDCQEPNSSRTSSPRQVDLEQTVPVYDKANGWC
jgi:pimeloyl-ACP methyl ester carboxylesterase